jgi:hypothetical protein
LLRLAFAAGYVVLESFMGICRKAIDFLQINIFHNIPYANLTSPWIPIFIRLHFTPIDRRDASHKDVAVETGKQKAVRNGGLLVG